MHEGLVLRFLKPHAAIQGPLQAFAPSCDGLVDLVHPALAQQRLVSVALLGLHDEEHHPGGLAVQPVHGHQACDAEQLFHPYQGRFMQVAAAGHGGQEVRFVDGHEVLALVQDGQLERHARFGRGLAPVPIDGAGQAEVIGLDARAMNV